MTADILVGEQRGAVASPDAQDLIVPRRGYAVVAVADRNGALFIGEGRHRWAMLGLAAEGVEQPSEEFELSTLFVV